MMRTWFTARSRREQMLLGIAALLLLMLFFWLVLVKPAIQTLRNAPQDIAELKQQLGTLEQQAEAIAALAQMPAPIPIPISQAKKIIEQLLSDPSNFIKIEQASVQSLSISAEQMSPELIQQFVQLVHDQLHARITSAKWQWANGYWRMETQLEFNHANP